MAQDLSSLSGLIDAGNYQGAYDQGRAMGYDASALSDWVNQTYGTNLTAEGLISSYETPSQANLANAGYQYATYANGVGMGTPIATPTAVNTYAPGSAGAQLSGLSGVDYASYANPYQASAQQELKAPPNSSNVVIAGQKPVSPNTSSLPAVGASVPTTPLPTAPVAAPAAPAAPQAPSAGTVTLSNGTTFTFGGLNADGTANWTRSDGQVFNNIDRATALSYGLSEADATAYYGAGTTPTTSTGTGLINAPDLTPTEVAAPKSLEERINDLTSQDSEYMQAAETAALQDMNARGLLDSSMAIGAAEAARINAALPVAQGDLAAELETMGLSENARQFDSSLGNEQWEFDENLQMEYWKQTLGDDQARDLAQLDADTRTALAQIEQVYLSQAQMSASAVDSMTKGYAVISGILQDPNMDEASKQNAVDVMLGGLQEQMNMISAIYSAPTLSSQLVGT